MKDVLIARIEFEVSNEEDFEEQKDASSLDGETWTLIRIQKRNGGAV